MYLQCMCINTHMRALAHSHQAQAGPYSRHPSYTHHAVVQKPVFGPKWPILQDFGEFFRGEGPMSSAQTFAPDRFRSKSKLGYFCLWVNAAQTTLFAPPKTSIFSPNSLGIPYRKLSLGGPFCNGPKTLEISKTADNKNIPI